MDLSIQIEPRNHQKKKKKKLEIMDDKTNLQITAVKTFLLLNTNQTHYAHHVNYTKKNS